MIRPAVPGDAEVLVGLFTELGHPENSVAEVRARIVAWTADPACAALVAEVDGQVVGVVGLVAVPYLEQPGKCGRVVAIVTSSAARGQGVGRRLMAAAEDVARQLGCVRMELTSANRRTDAHAFYGNLGYENWADRSGRFRKDLAAT